MTPAPLAGRRVVVTRTRAQAPTLVDRLERLGASVVELPVIAVVDPADGGAALGLAAHRLVSGAYQWVAVTSSNAVSRLLSALDGRPVPSRVRWAAVGSATARALAEGGVEADLVPAVSLAEALAEAFPPVAASGPGSSGTVLFPRAETVRGTLAAGLRAKGWLLDEVVAYRTVASAPAPEAVDAAREADVITFTSSSTVEHALELLGTGGLPPVVVSIGPVTSGTARAAGVEVTREAEPHTIEGVAEAVVAALDPAAQFPPLSTGGTVPATSSDRGAGGDATGGSRRCPHRHPVGWWQCRVTSPSVPAGPEWPRDSPPPGSADYAGPRPCGGWWPRPACRSTTWWHRCSWPTASTSPARWARCPVWSSTLWTR